MRKNILQEYGITEKELKRLLVAKKKKPKIIRKAITSQVWKFGLVSDTHLCSKKEKLNELYTFYHICEKEGVEVVLHCGDMVAGQGIFRGMEQEIHTFGAMNQAKYVIRNYPKKLKTYFILGNHDLAYWKQNGVDIGEIISSWREDLVCLGHWQADLEIGSVKIRLLHPDGGMPYAISYKGQRIAERIASGTKPHILALGHLHTAYYFFYRNMHILGAGAFEGQTSFLLRRGINPTVGGWIIKIRTADDAKHSVVSITPSFIPFFD